MSPATPAAGMAWPIIDFTEPSPARRRPHRDAAEDALQRGELGGVAGRRRGAVRLDQAHRLARIEPGALPGALEREHLAVDARVHQAGARPSLDTPVPRMTA